jgi:hypothetical protein
VAMVMMATRFVITRPRRRRPPTNIPSAP